MGALLYFGYNYRVTLNNSVNKQIIPIILINLVFGFLTPGINNFAHIGGLLGGYLGATAVGVKYKSSKNEMVHGIISLVLLFLFLIYMSFLDNNICYNLYGGYV